MSSITDALKKLRDRRPATEPDWQGVSPGERERLEEMERLGEVKLGTGHIPEDFWTMRRPEDPEGEVMQALLDERESSR